LGGLFNYFPPLRRFWGNSEIPQGKTNTGPKKTQKPQKFGFKAQGWGRIGTKFPQGIILFESYFLGD